MAGTPWCSEPVVSHYYIQCKRKINGSPLILCGLIPHIVLAGVNDCACRSKRLWDNAWHVECGWWQFFLGGRQLMLIEKPLLIHYVHSTFQPDPLFCKISLFPCGLLECTNNLFEANIRISRCKKWCTAHYSTTGTVYSLKRERFVQKVATSSFSTLSPGYSLRTLCTLYFVQYNTIALTRSSGRNIFIK